MVQNVLIDTCNISITKIMIASVWCVINVTDVTASDIIHRHLIRWFSETDCDEKWFLGNSFEEPLHFGDHVQGRLDIKSEIFVHAFVLVITDYKLSMVPVSHRLSVMLQFGSNDNCLGLNINTSCWNLRNFNKCFWNKWKDQ